MYFLFPEELIQKFIWAPIQFSTFEVCDEKIILK